MGEQATIMRGWKTTLVASLLSLLAMTVEAAQAVGRVDEIAAQWNQALSERNLEALLKMSDRQAMVILADGRVVKDREEIRRFWQELLEREDCPTIDLKEVIYAGQDTLVSKIIWKQGKEGLEFMGEAYGVFKRRPDGRWVLKVLRWN